jgi:hypothetical protein
MRHLGILSLIACLAAASGCNLCCWGKRNAELTGPTDVRKSQLWCLGEDALFHQPMGPSGENYGLKKTCWREWPADGAPCADGSCGPMLVPGGMRPGTLPPQHPEPTLRNDSNPQLNPFRDDAQPIPSANGASRPSPQSRVGTATTPPKEFPTLFSAPGVTPKRTSTSVATKPRATKPAIPPRVITVAAPAVTPALIPKSATATPDTTPERRKMTISEPIDTPTRTLAPIAAPGTVTQTAAYMTAPPSETRATLAGLQHMLEVTPTSSNATGGPAVIRNGYVPAEPFELATRSTLPKKPTADPELAEETLSALGSMMGDRGSAGEN